jgi:hypothetical protein
LQQFRQPETCGRTLLAECVPEAFFFLATIVENDNIFEDRAWPAHLTRSLGWGGINPPLELAFQYGDTYLVFRVCRLPGSGQFE